MQHQVEMHRRVVPNAATVEPGGTYWGFNEGLGYAPDHGGQPAHVPTGSNIFHPGKPFQKAFPIRASQSGATTIQRTPAVPGGVLSSTHEQTQHKLRRKTPNGTIDAGYDGSPAQLIAGQPPLKHVILPLAPWQTPGQDLEPSAHPAGLASFNLQSVIPDPAFGARNTAPSVYQPVFPSRCSTVDPTLHAGSGYHNGEDQDGFARILERLGPTPAAYQPPQALHMSGYYPLLARSPQEAIQHPLAGPFNDDTSVSRGAAYGLPPGDVLGAQFAQSHQNNFHQPIHGLAQGSNFQGPPQSIQPSTYLNPSEGLSASKPPGMQNLNFQQKALAQAHHVYLRLIAQRHLRKAHSAKPGSGNGGSSKTFIYPKLPPLFPCHSEPPVESQSYPPLPSAPGQSGHFHASFRGPMNPDSGLKPNMQLFHEPGARGGGPSGWDQKRESLASAARVPLETLSHLCEQSNWKWMDAILLGGCLCYSVEDYEGALEWFFRLLALDSRYHIPHEFPAW